MAAGEWHSPIRSWSQKRPCFVPKCALGFKIVRILLFQNQLAVVCIHSSKNRAPQYYHITPMSHTHHRTWPICHCGPQLSIPSLPRKHDTSTQCLTRQTLVKHCVYLSCLLIWRFYPPPPRVPVHFPRTFPITSCHIQNQNRTRINFRSNLNPPSPGESLDDCTLCSRA